MNFTHFFDKKLPNNRLTQPLSKNSGSATISINLKMFISMEMDVVSNRITQFRALMLQVVSCRRNLSSLNFLLEGKETTA